MQFKLSFLIFCLLFLAACNPTASLENSLGNAKPDDNRFTKVVLTQGMDEPMEMAFLPDNKILIIERKGNVN